jgi:hypothetical protein
LLDTPSSITGVGTLTSLTMGGNITMATYSLLNVGSITSYFGSACGANQFINDIADDGTFSCATPTGTGTNATSGIGIIVNSTSHVNLNNTYMTSNFYNQTFANATFVKQSEESNLNVNSSNYWDSVDTVSQLINTHTHHSANITSPIWITTANETNLNVNSSGYWDLLNTPSDITGLISKNIASLNWTRLQQYPAACSANQYVTTINDTLTCSAVTGFLTDTGDTGVGNYDLIGNVSIGNSSGTLAGEIYFNGTETVFGMYSPNGSVYSCTVNNTGHFNCI